MHRDNPEKLGLVLPGADEPIAPTHWSFGQFSSLVGAPAAYLRQLPAPLAGINLQHGLTNHRAEQIKTMEVVDGRTQLRAVTGPDYGRIYDHELVRTMRAAARATAWATRGMEGAGRSRLAGGHLQAALERDEGDDDASQPPTARVPVSRP